MSSPDYSNPNALATLSCKKPWKAGKNPSCGCEPCTARLSIFGQNIGIAEQENRRMAVSKGVTKSLHQWAPKEV